jgi:hypothetical protein
MKTNHGSLLFIFLCGGALGAPALSAAAGPEASRTFVQATILASNPAKATITFLDASGRQRVERVAGEAVPSLATVRPGDQAILSMGTAAGASVVTRVRVHRPEPPPVETLSAAPVTPGVGSIPLKRTWPNPYAKGSRAGRETSVN